MEKINDILELIKSRRSITKYLPKAIPWEYVSRIVDAARHAPSCGNVQNWKFVVVLSPEKRKAIAEAALQQYWMITAPVHIVVLAMSDMAERYYGIRGERLYTVQNCAAAVQNMLLEAQSLGLGSCWIGGFDEEALKTLFKIPEEVRPQAVIAIGYDKEIPSKPPKYPLETLVYFGGWRRRMRDPAKYCNDTATILARKAQSAQESVKELAKTVKEKIKEKF